MERQAGTTMLELVTVLAVVAVLSGVVVPGASRARAAVSSAEAARRLALVLRSAQARAQSSCTPVRVQVEADGDYSLSTAPDAILDTGSLGAPVSSTYPGGVLEFGERGWAGLPGAGSPRAGHFDIGGSAGTVVVQLSGCIRCS